MNMLQRSAVVIGSLSILCAYATGNPGRGEQEGFRFQIGISYVSGLSDVDSALEKSFEAQGYEYDSFVLPVGLSLNPYYEFESGLAVGASVGPVCIGMIDSTADTQTFGIIPVGLDLRYTFLRTENVSPYVRLGVRYPFVFGDLVENGKAGVFGAVGVEFMRNRSTKFGLEISYDSSSVDVGYSGSRETVKPYEFMAGVFIAF